MPLLGNKLVVPARRRRSQEVHGAAKDWGCGKPPIVNLKTRTYRDSCMDTLPKAAQSNGAYLIVSKKRNPEIFSVT
jgi:hypothetical protein